METPENVNKEIDRLLLDAMLEIRNLRRQNEILWAKVDTMNLFATVLRTQPFYDPQGASVDVAWEIERHLSKKS